MKPFIIERRPVGPEGSKRGNAAGVWRFFGLFLGIIYVIRRKCLLSNHARL